MHAQLAFGAVEEQIALGVDHRLRVAGDGDADLRRVGARLHDEVVLEHVVAAIVEEIDPRIEPGLAELAIARHVAQPLRGVGADQVVRGAGRGLARVEAPGRLCADEAQAGCGACTDGLLVVGDECRAADTDAVIEDLGRELGAAGDEARLGRRLAQIGFEPERAGGSGAQHGRHVIGVQGCDSVGRSRRGRRQPRRPERRGSDRHADRQRGRHSDVQTAPLHDSVACFEPSARPDLVHVALSLDAWNGGETRQHLPGKHAPGGDGEVTSAATCEAVHRPVDQLASAAGPGAATGCVAAVGCHQTSPSRSSAPM